MSDLNQIHTALARLFNEEGHRIVFWNDPDKEFQSTLPFVMLDQVGALEVKIRVERDEPTEEPEFEDEGRPGKHSAARVGSGESTAPAPRRRPED